MFRPDFVVPRIYSRYDLFFFFSVVYLFSARVTDQSDTSFCPLISVKTADSPNAIGRLMTPPREMGLSPQLRLGIN